MAERSFTHEVGKLRLGAGQEFRGEGILAVTKALLQSGVGYVGGYQGAPISHLMDVLSDAQGLLKELGIHFEASASEAAAAAMLAASVNYPIRGAVTWKSTVGTNVASDALANVASGGVTGGALVIIGEDYGEGSSIMQERSHAFAMKSQMWLLDPRPNLDSIVAMVERGFELSEASNTPVMLELRIRACHVYGSFIAHDNRPPPFTLQDALDSPVRDVNRIVLPPASFLHEQEKINRRWPAAVEYIVHHRLNEFLGGTAGDIGIILQGGLYNMLIRALELLGLADSTGETQLPLYVLNVTYPLIDSEVVEFCRGRKAVLIVEEGQPEYLEHNLNTILRKADIATRVVGKDVLPKAGEYTGDVLQRGVRAFMRAYAPEQLERATPLLPPPPAELPKEVQALAALLPIRPPAFCTGCPERPIFTAMKLLQRELGQVHISCDIGCHLFSILPPFNLGNTTMGYGLGAAGASAFNAPRGKRAIAVMGDGGFWHNGLLTGVAGAAFNRDDSVLVIMNNGYSSATGIQDIPSSLPNEEGRGRGIDIEATLKSLGLTWVKRVRTYGVAGVLKTLKQAMTEPGKGLRVIIADGECQLARQRRVRPAIAKAVAAGERVVRTRFWVDPDVCTGDHSCMRLSGCPSLTLKPSEDPLRTDPIAHVNNDCVGCGLCGEVAHAAQLCPSFAQIDIIQNPSAWDRLRMNVSRSLIRLLGGRPAAMAPVAPAAVPAE